MIRIGRVRQQMARHAGECCAMGLLGLSWLQGCSSSNEPEPEPKGAGGGIFGGPGASAAGTDVVLEPEPEVETPPCGAVPVGTELWIDDFEDGDAQPRLAPGRLGFWTVQHDETEGAMTPDGSVEPVVGGANGTDFALHATATGYSDWGVSVDVHFMVASDGLNCPYNAENTRGVGLYLKGSGRVRIGASTAAVVSTEFGGTCNEETQTCWDSHLDLIPLNAEWTYREVTWDALAQAGWGTPTEFDAGALKVIRVVALPGDLPLDVWVDELRFLPLVPETPDAEP